MSAVKANQVLNLDGDRIGSVVVDSIANMKNLNTEIEANATVELLGYYSKGDGGGGTFYWDSTSIEDDNGGTIIEATGVVDGRYIRNYSGAVDVKWFGAVGDGVVDDTTSIQAAIDYIKTISINPTGGQYDLSKTPKVILSLDGGHYLIKKPLNCYDVDGLFIDGGNALIEMATVANGWENYTRVDKTDTSTLSVKSIFMFGATDYATTGGKFSNECRVTNVRLKGNEQSTSRGFYLDVVANITIDNVSFQNLGYGINGKVVFLSNFNNLTFDTVGSLVYIKNTSVVDGYNSGAGLEGGGIVISNLKAYNEFAFNSEPKLYFYKCGELQVNNIISFGGLGKGLVIERAIADNATGMNWNVFNNIEIAETQGRPLEFSYVSKMLMSNIQIVKAGKGLAGLTACKFFASSEISINNLVIDNFVADSNYPGIYVTIEDCTAIRFSNGTILSVPNVDAIEAIVKFVNSTRCKFSMFNFGNTSVSGQKYNYIISSDANCNNIGIVDSDCLTGTTNTDLFNLLGGGDYYRNIVDVSGSALALNSNILEGVITYNPSNIATGSQETTTITVSGASLGDYATASFGNLLYGLSLSAEVTAANTVTVHFINNTGADVNTISGTLRVIVNKRTN